jgi:nicotinate-nucleotide pyrophosphorylase (carboxylating)
MVPIGNRQLAIGNEVIMWIDESELFQQIAIWLKEDVGRGDITTQATVPRDIKGTGKFLAKENLIVCGLEIAEMVFNTLDAEQELEVFVNDGDEVESGKIFARTSGYVEVLLSGERLALNLLQRLSGVATLTRKYVKAIEGTNAYIVDTRKTVPGLRMLEKYAVNIGGGRNHRYGLDDGVLIKDNHISIAGSVHKAVARAKERVGHLHKIEVEISNEDMLREAIEAGADIVMLDNQTPEETKLLVEIARELAPNVILESSGSINLSNVREYAEAGVDLISIGAITHSARAMDISFKIQLG